MSEAYKKLVKTLQTIFEMDKADLDLSYGHFWCTGR